MKRILIVAAAGVLLLAGCSATTASTSNAKSESTEPAIEPGPVELTAEDAGTYYLQLVCQSNAANQALTDAFIAHEDAFMNGEAPEVETVKAAASEAVRLDRQMIELIDDDYLVWPEGVADQLEHLRAQNMAALSTNQAIMNSDSYEAAYYQSYPEATAEQQAAAQEIRYQLKLDADATGSCTGYETGNDEIYTKMVDRNEQLNE